MAGKHFAPYDTLIEGSRCPRCSCAIAHNGNYFCSECDWIMPHPTRRKVDREAAKVAYVLLMQSRGEEPTRDGLASFDVL